MKNRKSKSDKTFRIDYCMWETKVVKNKGNVGGYEVRDQVLGPPQTASILSHNRASALRGFLWGMDRNNVRIFRCVPVLHLTGRFLITNGVPSYTSL